MTDLDAQVAIGLSVIDVTEHLMERYNISCKEAFEKLIGTDFYELLNIPDSGLCLEPEYYIHKACVLELEQGAYAMREYITTE